MLEAERPGGDLETVHAPVGRTERARPGGDLAELLELLPQEADHVPEPDLRSIHSLSPPAPASKRKSV